MPQPLYRDPWAKREAWRRHPIFSNRAMFRNLFPGFGIAVVAFAVYVAVDDLVMNPSETLINRAKEELQQGAQSRFEKAKEAGLAQLNPDRVDALERGHGRH